MGSIIYKSDNIIPWDTQSAFKMTSYSVSCEQNMIFCYLKAYVRNTDLILCSYCFTESPSQKANMHLYINPDPENSGRILQIDYAFHGVEKAVTGGVDVTGETGYTSFKADDEQGFYWCGEICLSGDFLYRHFGTIPQEKSIIAMNMVQSFENGNKAALFGDVCTDNYDRTENMETFVILNY